MLKRWWMMIALLPSVACTEAQLCALLGEFEGGFDGDVQGALLAVITADADDVADVSLKLTAESAVLEGSGKVGCTDGELLIQISSLDGALAGEVTGLLEGGTGHGDYELDNGAKGTWEY